MPEPTDPSPGTPVESPATTTVREEAREVLTDLTPWGMSIVFHAGLVLLAVFLAWNTASQTVDDELPIDVITSFNKRSEALAVFQANRVTSNPSPQRSVEVQRRPVATPGTPGYAANSGSTSNLIGLFGGGMSGGGSRSNPFGPGDSVGSVPEADLFGLKGEARKLVYLVDASGSLIDTFPFVINELKRSINELEADQSFTVIFFQDRDVIEVPPRGLRAASEENKRRVIEWIDPAAGNVVPRGGTTPVNALRLALQYKPHLMFLLSDNITGSGVFQVDQRRLLADIERANAGGTKINTIQYIYPDPLVTKGLKGTMELISNRSGGDTKYVDARDLQIK